MKLLRATKNKLCFRLVAQEKQLFLQVLQLYPRIPPAHHTVSKTASDASESQRLLDEALDEQRAAHKKEIDALIHSPDRFTPTKTGWNFSLTRTEAEWLLQVLNDIRVGSWLSLGSPEDIHGVLNENTAPDFWAMEMSGMFQMQLLHALQSGG